MGYTHYFAHRKRFTKTEWVEIQAAVRAICATAEQNGIQIGDFGGESPGPVFMYDCDDAGPAFGFNGFGTGNYGDDLSHETFIIYKNRTPLESWQTPDRRGCDFCKTARKPYDVAVTAVLCYLESVFPKNLSASSDGNGKDWQEGLALARKALPSLANILDIPASVKFSDQFKQWLISGNRFGAAVRLDDAVCVYSGMDVMAVFEGEAAGHFLKRLERANIPRSGRVDDLARARDKFLRKQFISRAQLGGRAPDRFMALP